MRAALVALCALATLACARGARPAHDDTVPMAADTLRGTVAITGSEPGTWAVLRRGAGRRDVTLLGDRRLLDRAAGLVATVWGSPGEEGAFRVERFEIRSSGGVPAVDGIVARRGAGYVLVTHDGRVHPAPHLPDELRAMPGARVWLAGPLDQPPQSYGILAGPAGR